MEDGVAAHSDSSAHERDAVCRRCLRNRTKNIKRLLVLRRGVTQYDDDTIPIVSPVYAGRSNTDIY